MMMIGSLLREAHVTYPLAPGWWWLWRKMGFDSCFLGCLFPTALDGQGRCAVQSTFVAYRCLAWFWSWLLAGLCYSRRELICETVLPSPYCLLRKASKSCMNYILNQAFIIIFNSLLKAEDLRSLLSCNCIGMLQCFTCNSTSIPRGLKGVLA